MAEWTIYSKDGVAKATVKELELHDEWMAECFLTITIKSAAPIDFAVGDYIDYRNERYSINYDPSKIKRARRGTYGEGFVYDNIKFVAVQDELVRCDFCDLVLSDNNIHYTQLSTFPFYCETVDDLLDRIQANMEDLYPGSWIIISPDLNRDRQRGLCVDREQAFIDAYDKYIGEGSEFKYEKTGVALTVDNINCWDALAKVNTDFALNFIVRDRIVIVGTAGVFTPKKFRYGKGNGLYELEAIGDSEQKVVTRLRAYGSEQNLPDRYYAERNLRVFSTVTDIYDKYDTDYSRGIAFFTDLRFSAKYFTYRSQSYPGPSDRPNYIVRMSAHGHEVTGFVSTDYSSDNFYIYSEYKGDIPDDRDEENREEMTAFLRALEVGDKVYFTAYVEKGAFDAAHTEASETSLPDNMAVNKLMLPGFPDMSLDEWVRANRPELIEEGFEFSTNPVRPYIDSPNKERYGIRPSNIFFDGTGDTDDIHPTLEGMTWDGHACDVVVEAEQIEDNGVLSDNSKEDDKRVTITIPYAGFKLNEEWVDGATISMKDGMCGARDFKILNKPTQNNDGNWICVCERAYDSVLKMYFPYSDFQIHKGDKFVLTGIDLPDSYIEAASVKLFDAAMDALRKNHLSRVTYQPKIDHIWMAHQHDTAMASGGAIESLHDTLKAGDYFSFADEDLGIDASIIIDILTIKEHADSGLATYEITLRDEKVVSALEKRLEKIVSDASGNGGSYSMRQTGSLVEQIGNELFLSKVEDDDAAGAIGFMKGIWFGIKDWFIDNTGSANLFDATINGLLKAYNAVINKVKSANFSGYGMLDTGWNIENDYEGTDSYAVFDRLYIRKKAIFEELELRKISHIGGNFCLSPASGRAYQVEYYDADGKQLGIEEKTVPWVLGYKVLMLFSRSMANKYLGKRKMIERPLTEAERQLVKRVRVYLFSDDGTTKTMSNWTVGAQARCQTFNIESQMDYHGSGEDSDNPDVNYWTGRKVQNTYWWRLVSAVGEGTLRDGKKHSYIEFLCNTDNEYVVADTGSDLPAVGDEFGQFGHRTDTSQQNVIMIETSNPDSPSLKFYRGVNSWSLEGKRKTVLSPMGTEIYSQRYHIETAYDDVIVPMDRGEWVSGTEYYYYDRVSHGGSLWLCIIPEGSSTTDEPSDTSVAWQKQVAKGDKGETSFKSLVFKRSATKPSKPTGGSYASPVPSGWSDGIPSGTNTIWMSSRIFTTDGKAPQQSAWTAVQLMSDTESFDVEFSPVVSNPGNPTDNPDNWYDPTTDPSADWENMIWMATRTKNNGVWGNWEITKVKGEKGSFKSRVFKRTNSDISGTRPTGGSYDSPIPTSGGWTDGIPSGDAILWSSVRTFDVGGGTTEWSLPVQETDTATLDIEFSPNATCPAVPYGTDASQKDSTTYINKRTAQGWHDPSRLPTGTMIWRAECKIKNGAYELGADSKPAWVMTRIYGEKGDAGNFKSTVFKRTNTKPNKPTGGSYSTPVPSGWSDGVPDGSNILWASTNVFYSTGGSSGWTEPKQMTDTADFDVEFSSVASPKAPSGHPNTNTQWSNTSDSTTIWMATSEYHNGVWSDWQVSKIKGEKGIDGTNAITTALKYTGPLADSATKPTVATYKNFTWTDGIPTQTEAKPNVYVGIWQYDASTILDISKTAPKSISLFAHYGKTGSSGTSPYFADIDNEMDSIPCDSNGKTVAAYDVTVNVSVWHGSTEQTLTKLTTTSVTGVTITANKTNKTVRFQVSSGTTIAEVNRIGITVASSESGDMSLSFTLNGVRAGKDGSPAVIYTLVPSVSSVVKKKNGTYSVQNVSCTRQKNVGGTITNNTTDGTITYKLDGGTETSYTNNTNIAVTNFTKSIQFIFKVNSVVVDTETIPMVGDGDDGTDGKNGTSILAAPNAIIINQQRTSEGAESLSSINYPIVVVARDSGTIVKSTISSLTATRCTASITKNNATDATVTITAIKKYTESGKTKYYTSGSVAFNVTATTAAGNAFTASISVPFGCNLLGQYTIDIEEDVKTEVSSKVTAEIDERNLVNTTDMTTAITQSAKGLTTEINKVNNRLNEGGDIATSISNTNSRVSTAEGNIQTISVDMLDVLDISKWERGTTTDETASKTYDDIKTTSTTRIRTKTLIPITAGTTFIMNNSSYQVGFVFFNSSKKTVVVSGTTSAWSGWKTGGKDTITIGKPSGAAYVAIVIRKSDDSAVATSAIPALNLALSNNCSYTRNETASLVETKITDNNGNYYTKTETANLVSQSVSDKVTTTTFEQTVNSINTTVAGKVSTSTFNQTVNSINASVTSVSEDAKTVIDVSKWEQGTTGNETAGKTYDQIKYDSNIRIRTKVLIPITGTTVVSMPRTTYSISIILFDSSKKTVNWTGTSSASTAWIQGSSNVISVHGATNAAYMAILIKKNTEAAISPSDITDANLYVTDKAFLSQTGIDITTGKIKLRADKVTFENSAGTVNDKMWIDATTGTLHAVDGDFSGKITATSGSIGGFSIGTNELKNTNYNASVNIQNAASSPTQVAKIGKDATDAMTGLSCSLQAESTKSGTYNTALYLKASGGTYNYAFHGEGNGVLNGLVFGFKTQFLTIPPGSTQAIGYIELHNGSTIVLKGTHSSGNVAIAMPKLSNVRQCLGLPSNSSTAFAIEINIINLSSYGDLYLSFRGDTHAGTTLGSDYPYWMSPDDTVWGTYVALAKGDYMKYMLIYSEVAGSSTKEYRAYLLIERT